MDVDNSNTSYKEDSIIWNKPGNAMNTSDEDVWDDTALVKAYDKAIAQLKEESTNVASSSSQSISSPGGKKRRKKNKKVKNNRKKWKIGEQCLAIFEEDGLYYEAVVITADNVNSTATVKFSYYENEENVVFDQLLPIHNKDRMKVAWNINTDEEKPDENESNLHNVGDWNVSDICYVFNSKSGTYQQAVINSFTSSKLCHITIIKSNQKSEVNISQLHETLPDEGCNSSSAQYDPHGFHSFPDTPIHLPPPPPFLNLPEFAPHDFGKMESVFKNNISADEDFSNIQFPHIPAMPVLPKDVVTGGKEEALANMLMSWYMSGFHTGYYQGLQYNNGSYSGKRKNQRRSRDKK